MNARTTFLPLLALVGASIALATAFWSGAKVPPLQIPFTPPESPYLHSIGGEGIVEAASRNITIGSPFSAIVTSVFVIEGMQVKAGDLLFQLDTRLIEAQAMTARSQVRAAIVNLENQKSQFSFYERLQDKQAVSEQDYELRFYTLKEAEEQVKIAQAQLGEVEATLAQSLVQAPIDGEILQVNLHVGEVAPNTNSIFSQGILPYGSSQYPLILMGSVTPLHVRIDIDEEDAWRYRKGSAATAFVRGNGRIRFPLHFVRVEPYIVPKASFTGATTERIDTRVLQVLYRFEKGDLPIYPGQVLDIFLEASS